MSTRPLSGVRVASCRVSSTAIDIASVIDVDDEHHAEIRGYVLHSGDIVRLEVVDLVENPVVASGSRPGTDQFTLERVADLSGRLHEVPMQKFEDGPRYGFGQLPSQRPGGDRGDREPICRRRYGPGQRSRASSARNCSESRTSPRVMSALD